MTNKKDFYEILDIPSNAAPEEIKKAYKKLAMKYHPDKVQGEDKAESEVKFKEISEAYSVLSDIDKRERYDRLGTYEETGDMNFSNVNDILNELFSGNGMSQGFEFFQMGGMPSMSQGIGSSFKMFFGGNTNSRGHQNNQDVIEIRVNMTELYKGVIKKVAYEVIDKCDACLGTGAKDPSDIISCLSCNGNGHIPQQMGPFMIQQPCQNCSGRGQMIKQNRICTKCKGERIKYFNRSFDLRIPYGVPHQHIHKMDGKGSYDIETSTYNDLILVFVHEIDTRFEVDYTTCDVHTKIDILLEELLCGFDKVLQIYDEKVPLYSKGYFNPNIKSIIKGKGLPLFKKKDFGDLVVTYNVIFPEDTTKLRKYHNVFMTMFKKTPLVEPPENATQIHHQTQ